MTKSKILTALVEPVNGQSAAKFSEQAPSNALTEPDSDQLTANATQEVASKTSLALVEPVINADKGDTAEESQPRHRIARVRPVRSCPSADIAKPRLPATSLPNH